MASGLSGEANCNGHADIYECVHLSLTCDGRSGQSQASPTRLGRCLLFPRMATVCAKYSFSQFAHSRHDCLIATTSILARVGVSFISSEQACANAEEEIPDFDFERVRSASRSQWNELLGRVQVDTTNVDPEIVDLFYSSFYRTHLSPADCANFSRSVVPSLTAGQIPARTLSGTLLNHTTTPFTAT